MGTAGKKTNRKQIDTGKIKALRAAGWPVKEIAGEMGCSTVTVYKYLNDEEK